MASSSVLLLRCIISTSFVKSSEHTGKQKDVRDVIYIYALTKRRKDEASLLSKEIIRML